MKGGRRSRAIAALAGGCWALGRHLENLPFGLCCHGAVRAMAWQTSWQEEDQRRHAAISLFWKPTIYCSYRAFLGCPYMKTAALPRAFQVENARTKSNCSRIRTRASARRRHFSASTPADDNMLSSAGETTNSRIFRRRAGAVMTPACFVRSRTGGALVSSKWAAGWRALDMYQGADLAGQRLSCYRACEENWPRTLGRFLPAGKRGAFRNDISSRHQEVHILI